MEIEVLGEQVIHESGCYRRVRRWLRGIHPERGVIVRGLTGFETLVEVDVIRAMHTFTVLPEAGEAHSASVGSEMECLDLQTVS